MCLAWKAEGLEPTAKLVLLALADGAGQDGERACIVSTANIARKTGLSKQGVQDYLAEFVRMGLLQPVTEESSGNTYNLFPREAL